MAYRQKYSIAWWSRGTKRPHDHCKSRHRMLGKNVRTSHQEARQVYTISCCDSIFENGGQGSQLGVYSFILCHWSYCSVPQDPYLVWYISTKELIFFTRYSNKGDFAYPSVLDKISISAFRRECSMCISSFLDSQHVSNSLASKQQSRMIEKDKPPKYRHISSLQHRVCLQRMLTSGMSSI